MPQTRAQGQAEQLKHQQDKIDQQKTRIEVLEAKVLKQEADLAQWRKHPTEMHAALSSKQVRKMEAAGGGAGEGAGGGKRKSPDTEYQAAGGGAGFVHDDAGAGNWLKHDTYPDTYIV